MNHIDAVGLRKEYGTLVAVADVDFQVDQGQVLGLIGPNGAGKTTLLKILATLLRPNRGTARILDLDIDKDYLAIRKHIGYLPDFFNLYPDISLEQCLWFFAASYEIPAAAIPERIAAALHDVALEDKRHETHWSPVPRHGPAYGPGRIARARPGHLSAGRNRPRVWTPRPESNCVTSSRKLSRAGKTIIISSHILTELSGFCSHIAIMNKGAIVRQGSVDQIRNEMTGSKTVTITVLDSPARAAEVLRTADIPVTISDVSETSIIATINGGQQDIAAINALLVAHDIAVCGLTESRMDIEETVHDDFLRHTGVSAGMETLTIQQSADPALPFRPHASSPIRHLPAHLRDGRPAPFVSQYRRPILAPDRVCRTAGVSIDPVMDLCHLQYRLSH